MLILKYLVFLTTLFYSECANILYVVPFTSKSHYIYLKPLGLELARRGHNVTVITGYVESSNLTNYHQIQIEHADIWDLLGQERPNVFTMTDISAEAFHDFILWRGGLAFTEKALTSKSVQTFFNSNSSFDLVISEQFFQEALYTLAHKYNAPLALVNTFGNCMRHNIVTRNPLQLATVIGEFIDLPDPFSFWARLRNFYFTFYEFAWWRYWYLEKQQALVKKYIPGLPDDTPSLYDIQKNVTLFLMNSHFSFDTPTAYLPNIVEVGGMHLTQSSMKLPTDLQNILDSSTTGVVYLNFGSNVRSSELPIDKRKAFEKVFGELNHTILWKWEDDDANIKTNNIVMRKWFPQREILGHPNIKVFISHGGLIGTQEAIFNGVPVIGIPIYADQYNNILQMETHGFGKILKYQDITEDNLRRILSEILNNNSYQAKAKVVSRRFKDRPMKAVDTAVFWLEYVIRNNGADFMKNPAIQLNWISYNMYDVYLFIFVVLSLFMYLLFRVVSAIVRLVQSKKMDKRKKH